MKKIITKKVTALTLIEILVVLVIIGIFTLIVLPNQTSVISDTRAVEAQTQLGHLHSLQKTYFWKNHKYGVDLNEIGFEQAKLSSQGGSANYSIEIISATASGFIAKAVAVVDFDGDGTYNEWEIDQEKNLIEKTRD